MATAGCHPADDDHGDQNEKVEIDQQTQHADYAPYQQDMRARRSPAITGDHRDSEQNERLEQHREYDDRPIHAASGG